MPDMTKTDTATAAEPVRAPAAAGAGEGGEGAQPLGRRVADLRRNPTSSSPRC